MFKKGTFIFFVLFILASCGRNGQGPPPDKLSGKASLLTADRAFSRFSEDKGMKAAFIEYMDSDAVLLRPQSLPIAGAEAVDYFLQLDDSGYIMNWKPQHAELAASGDMGYTYGVYAIHQKRGDSTSYGTYINVWKKQSDGKWKIAIETANEGIEPTQTTKP